MKAFAIVQMAVCASILLLGSANAVGPCNGQEKGCMDEGYKTCEQKHPHNVDAGAWPAVSGPTSCSKSKKLLPNLKKGSYYCFCKDLGPKPDPKAGTSTDAKGETSTGKKGDTSNGKKGKGKGKRE